MRVFTSGTGALALAFFAGAPAAATSMRVASLDELAVRSELTVVGRVVSRASFWSGGRILTRVGVATEEVWNGSLAAGGTVDVITLGGVVGDVGQRVEGCPVIAVGERVVLLLAGTPAAGYHPLGLWQGVFWVDGPGDAAAVRQPVPDVNIVGPARLAVPHDLGALRSAIREARRAAR